MEKYKEIYIDYLLKVKGDSLGYAKLTDCWIRRLLGFLKEKEVKDIAEVTRPHLEEYQKFIQKEGYSKRTAFDILSVARLFFTFLYDYGHIKENPALVIESPHMEKRIPRPILNKDELKFLMSLPNKDDLIGMRDYAIIKLLYSTSMRPIEVFNLKMDDIDFKRNQIIVRRPKNRRDRIVHFDKYTANYLKAYIEKARQYLLRGRKLDNVFLSLRTNKLTSSAWATHFNRTYASKFKKKYNKRITPYCIRHTSATDWYDSGAKQKKDVLSFVQKQLGHVSIESTYIYTRVGIEALRQMFKRCHPREVRLKNLHKIPSPENFISRLKDKENNK